MGAKQDMEKFDLGKLVAEAGAEVDALIKSERDRLESLKKSEESSSSSSSSSSMAKKEFSSGSEESNLMNKKEESSSSSMVKKEGSRSESSMKKDENSSGYESQAPEAAPADPASAPPASEDGAAPQQDGGEDLQSMVSSLDDQMLDELMQTVMMEKDARKGSAAPVDGQSAPSSAQAPPAPPMDSASMAMKSELEKYQEKLAKSEAQAADLQKSFSSMTELLDKMINRPVQKAVTDVRNIEYIDKGEKDQLKKNESANISDADLKKKAVEISQDPKKLGALAKSERDTLLDYLVSKKRNPEVLKIVSK